MLLCGVHMQSMAKIDLITIEVAWASPDEQQLISVEVPAGSLIRQAIETSGMLQRCPAIDLESSKVGVFGRLATLSDTVQAGDRIEIYRPLLLDPKEQRRRRAARKGDA